MSGRRFKLFTKHQPKSLTSFLISYVLFWIAIQQYPSGPVVLTLKIMHEVV